METKSYKTKTFIAPLLDTSINLAIQSSCIIVNTITIIIKSIRKIIFSDNSGSKFECKLLGTSCRNSALMHHLHLISLQTPFIRFKTQRYMSMALKTNKVHKFVVFETARFNDSFDT